MTASHPLDPLDADEIRTAAQVLRDSGRIGLGWRIASIELAEPAKDIVRGFAAGDPIERTAILVCWDRDDGSVTYKAFVSLNRGELVSWLAFPGAQANATVDEFHEAVAAVMADATVLARLAERGINRPLAGHGRHLDVRQARDSRTVCRPPPGLGRSMGT